MDAELTNAVKTAALDAGVARVGIAGLDSLAGPLEADPRPLLPTATAVVSYLAVEPEDAIMKYLSKEDPGPYRGHFYENIQLMGRTGLAVAALLRSRGYSAVPLSPNLVYTGDSNLIQGLKPPFSHRYAAVGAGLGAIGLSANVMTPEYGARVCLGSVICDAPLLPDRPLEDSPCTKCRCCIDVCASGFMSRTETVSFSLGGREITHSKRGLHARCAITCGGFAGLSRDGRWSTWAPADHAVPGDDPEMVMLLGTLAAGYARKHAGRPELPDFYRMSEPMEGYPESAQGVLARSRLDTVTTCGNCAIVCFETKEQRVKARRALRKSGLVFEDGDGAVRVVRGPKGKKGG